MESFLLSWSTLTPTFLAGLPGIQLGLDYLESYLLDWFSLNPSRWAGLPGILL
jgi:hypothetical protein